MIDGGPVDFGAIPKRAFCDAQFMVHAQWVKIQISAQLAAEFVLLKKPFEANPSECSRWSS